MRELVVEDLSKVSGGYPRHDQYPGGYGDGDGEPDPIDEIIVRYTIPDNGGWASIGPDETAGTIIETLLNNDALAELLWGVLEDAYGDLPTYGDPHEPSSGDEPATPGFPEVDTTIPTTITVDLGNGNTVSVGVEGSITSDGISIQGGGVTYTHTR